MLPSKGGVSFRFPPTGVQEQRLPPTQYMESDYATTGCSKALWGLRLRVECTDCAPVKSISPDVSRGQWSPRWTIHASRQLSDKVLRYLKRVMLPRCLLVSSVETRFKIPALSRIQGLYTTFDLAVPYVFIKQSGPSHCDQIVPNLALFSRSYGAILPSSLKILVSDTP